MLALNARIVAVGKVKKQWIADGIQEYWKRLPELKITEIKDSTPAQEAEKIRANVRSHERLIVLSEQGTAMTSLAFARWIEQSQSTVLVFAIGGPDGTHASLEAQCDRQISLSAMTFTHELARLFLVEQLYRAKTILIGTGYHRS
jgi:23S rRNA (pseudouridine1915-N3)-methyltransferase